MGIGSYVRIDVRLLNAAYPSWSSPVQVYFCRMNDGWKLTGLYRNATSTPGLIAKEK
jgi:hypothetical protein